MKSYLYRLLAFVLFCTVASSAFAHADYQLGNKLYRHGSGQPANFPAALQAFLLAGADDHASAQFYIGRMYQLGHGTPTNLPEAVRWYLQAGKNGQARAWNNLGNVFKTEGFANYSTAKTIKCYEHASKMGMAMASTNLAKVYHFGKYDTPRDYAKAETLYLLTLKQSRNYSDVWYYLGRLYEYGGHGIERNLEAARHAYTKSAGQQDAYGYYNLAELYYHGKLEAEPEVFIDFYTKAAERGHAKAMARLGWIYKTGLYGPVDRAQALQYYEAAAAKGHANAQNSLATLLVDMNLELDDSPRVIELYAAAAKQNNIYAINNYGHRIVAGDVPGMSIEAGIELLRQAASKDYPNAMTKLANLATQSEFQHYFTDQEIKHWAAKKAEVKQQARATAKRILEAARPAVEQGRYDDALAILRAKHHNNDFSEIDRDQVSSAFWWEAQTIGGRADPEWGWRLFTWLKEIYDRDVPNGIDRILVCNNIANSLAECGRTAQIRQICQQAEALILSMHGLVLRPPAGLEPAADYTFPADAYTIRYSAAMLAPIVNHSGFDEGDWIQRTPMETSLICADEQLTRAHWGEAFFISGQVEHWAREVLGSGTFPKGTNRGWMLSNLSEALLIKAEAYTSLGLHQQALDCYNSIIDEEMRSYGGRDMHQAITRRARLLTQLGNAAAVDLEQLRKTIEKRRDNQFENRDAYQFTQLAIAHASHQQGNRDAALALVAEILESTQTSSYTFLRIEALRVQIECALADGQIDGIENALIEIIELARSKGLNNLEPTLYELYAQYLAHSEQWQAAQRIQQQAIDLLQRLQMQPRLAPAITALNELRNHSPAEPTLQQYHFDLQPSRITSAPLPGQGSITVFSLSNLEDSEHEFQLSLNGQAISILRAPNETALEPEPTQTHQLQALKFHLLPANPDEGAAAQTQATLTANQQLLIEIHAPASIFESGDQQLHIQASIGGQQQQVGLILLADAGAADIAVIDAIELIDNPYYLVPAFHSISSMSDDSQAIGLRAIASQPTRIEAYNSNNELLFIDAEGNGHFNDPGDLINSELAADLSPIIPIEANTIQVEFRYQPHSNTDERVDIQIQTRQNADESNWETQVIDWIQPPEARD